MLLFTSGVNFSKEGNLFWIASESWTFNQDNESGMRWTSCCFQLPCHIKITVWIYCLTDVCEAKKHYKWISVSKLTCTCIRLYAWASASFYLRCPSFLALDCVSRHITASSNKFVTFLSPVLPSSVMKNQYIRWMFAITVWQWKLSGRVGLHFFIEILEETLKKNPYFYSGCSSFFLWPKLKNKHFRQAQISLKSGSCSKVKKINVARKIWRKLNPR